MLVINIELGLYMTNMEDEFRTYISQFLLIWRSPWIESTREAWQVEANNRLDAAGQSQNV